MSAIAKFKLHNLYCFSLYRSGRSKWFRVFVPATISSFFENVLLPKIMGNEFLNKNRDRFDRAKRAFLNEQQKCFTKVVVSKFIAEGNTEQEAKKKAMDFLYQDSLKFVDQHKVKLYLKGFCQNLGFCLFQKYLQQHNDQEKRAKSDITVDVSKLGKLDTERAKNAALERFAEATRKVMKSWFNH